MGFLLKIFVVVIAIIIGIYFKLNQVDSPPKLNDNQWWGKGTAQKQDTSIRPFKINVSDEVLKDLNVRLENHRPLTPSLEGSKQHYGINTKLLNKIIEFWKTKYNWRQREKYLNQYPQFKTNIQGLDIHFLHVKPKNIPQGTKVLPLLLLHGWPGSVVEFYETIPLFTTPKKGYNFVFEVIVPSLPGYGFSEATTKPGLSVVHLAVIFNNLMKRLGHETYYVQGGDWGSAIAKNLGLLYPNNVKGIHLNMCFSSRPITNIKWLLGSLYPPLVVSKEREQKLYPISNVLSTQLLEFGYMHLQATKPDTVGIALTDSPVGLAAYILEKFTTWTNPNWKDLEDGGLEKKFTLERLLDNIMVYYITNSITTSMRLYSESINSQSNPFTENTQVMVKSACLSFEHEIVYQPENFIKDTFPNIIHFKDYHDGGHFAAFELPGVLANDVWQSIQIIEDFPKKQS